MPKFNSPGDIGVMLGRKRKGYDLAAWKRAKQAKRAKTGQKIQVAQKRTVGTQTKRKQKTTFNDFQGGELTMRQVQGGRNTVQNLASAWKVLNTNKQRNVYFVENVSRYMAPASATLPPGNVFAGTLWTGNSIGVGTMTAPLHLWSLSAAPNVTNGVASASPPNALSILTRNGVSADYTFAQYSPYGISNVAGAKTGVQSFPGQTDMLKAVSIKTVLYGCLSRPTKFRLDLVQILDESLHPDYILQTALKTTAGLGEKQLPAINTFNELSREFTYSPATFQDGGALKGKIRYIKSWTHLIQPKLTTEPAAVDNINGAQAETTISIPHSHIFNIYHQFNRRQNYAWDDSVASSEPLGDATDSPAVQTGINYQDVTYRARIYLMVRALAPSPCLNGVWEVTRTPSYDCSIRTYHENLG